MEHLKTYYSLERHLDEVIKINPQFEVLGAIWKLNKKNLASALTNVGQSFPHYSLHEKSHSNTIISNIESFLGQDRVERLGPTDTWLILMASYTHDLGMVVFNELVERSWATPEFQHFLQELSDWDDEEIKKGSKLLLSIQKLSSEQNDSSIAYNPIEIKNAVTLVVAEYVRRIHHLRSADILKGVDAKFNEIANSFYSDQIPNRLLTILGEVAYLHGTNFYDIFERLDYQSNGISSDKIHPRFIAAMLRLGDLLDIDDNRFNLFTEQVFKMPQSSNYHKQKHSSIKHFLITPDAIEITSDCPNEQVYRLARSWFDALEKEVENQSKEWSNLAPKDLNGSSPQIPKGKIKVYYNGDKADDKLLNLRFEVSNQKIFEILEGASIYEKAEFTFIRELVQNALDASKIQLWNEIKSGVYDIVIHKHLIDNKFIPDIELTHQQLLDKIIFPFHLPEFLFQNFKVKLIVRWKGNASINDLNKVLEIIVEDNGIGISDNTLVRMTSKVGESRSKENGFDDLLKSMPFWLKPTGAFGIGLQSIFVITDSFRVETKADGEISKEIIFRSSKRGKYTSKTPNKPILNRGTRVIVEVPEEKFSSVFGTSFDMGIVHSYDYFTDKYGSIYIRKIKAYLDETLFKVDNLVIDFMGEKTYNKISIKKEEDIVTPLPTITSEENNMSCTIEHINKDLFFCFFETTIGSLFILKFPSDISIDKERNWIQYQTDFFVRGMPVKDNLVNYYRLSYSKLIWDFMSPKSDKILSLNREKLLSNEKRKIGDIFLKNVIPQALELAERSIKENSEKIMNFFSTDADKERLALLYFKFLLTRKINHLEIKNDNIHIFGEYPLNNFFATYANDEECKLKDFFQVDEIIVPYSSNYFNLTTNRVERCKEIFNRYKDTNTNSKALVIFNSEFFVHYLVEGYTINKIVYINETDKIFYLTKFITNFEYIQIVDDNQQYFLGFFNNADRGWNYSIDQYAHQLSVINEHASGFEYFPTFSRTSIISPFKTKKQFQALKEDILGNALDLNKDEILLRLDDSILEKYVTNLLVDFIIEYMPNGATNRNKKSIVEAYKDLICEMILNLNFKS